MRRLSLLLRQLRVFLIGKQERSPKEWAGILSTFLIALPLVSGISFNLFSSLLAGIETILNVSATIRNVADLYLEILARIMGIIVGFWCCRSYWQIASPVNRWKRSTLLLGGLLGCLVVLVSYYPRYPLYLAVRGIRPDIVRSELEWVAKPVFFPCGCEQFQYELSLERHDPYMRKPAPCGAYYFKNIFIWDALVRSLAESFSFFERPIYGITVKWTDTGGNPRLTDITGFIYDTTYGAAGNCPL